MLHHTDAFQALFKLLLAIEVQSRSRIKGKEVLFELQKICEKPNHQVTYLKELS